MYLVAKLAGIMISLIMGATQILKPGYATLPTGDPTHAGWWERKCGAGEIGANGKLRSGPMARNLENYV